MRRPDYSDIPEPFRRAFEEGWGDSESNDGGDQPPPTAQRQDIPPWWTNRNLWVVGLILLLLLSGNWLLNLYTDWLWFIERGYEAVWLRQLRYEFVVFLIFFVLSTTVLVGSWTLARRRAERMTVPAFSGPNFSNLPALNGLTIVIALFLSFSFASTARLQWEQFLLYFNRVPYGLEDPIFNRDISFYLFELPIYQFLQSWLMPLLVFATLGTIFFYALRLLPTLQSGTFSFNDIPLSLRRSIAIIGMVFFILWAIGYWFSTFDLLFSERGVVYGASYTDVNASLIALYAQIVAMILLALAFGWNYFRLAWKPIAAAAALWLIVTAGIGVIYPYVLQQFIVVPNEPDVERPYILNNINLTRIAFGLDQVEERQFGSVDILRQEDLDDNQAALENVRLWDYRPLLKTYRKLQELRTYYQFVEVDIDRYEIDGQIRQVMLSARELDKANLPNNTWVNRKLEFTHGYGIVMNPVDRFTSQGRPDFFLSDLPPRSNVDIEVTRPEIYFGEADNDVVFVGSASQEFSYPDDEVNVYTSYSGSGGVPIGSGLKQLAFALRFGETNLLFSEDVTPDTRAIYYRTVQERISQVAPFLLLDPDPYLVVTDDGHLVWIQDAYTTSSYFPYSEPITYNTDQGSIRINYIRNSVKITVDAYNGDINFYVTDETADPLIQAYMGGFPGLFQPMDNMPTDLMRHIRYPEILFKIQTTQYLTYHMTDSQVFYNKEDVWEIPEEIFDSGQPAGNSKIPMEPYYVMFRLPGEESTEYLLIQPYTPKGKTNMTAWIAARNDPENYGQLISYVLPRQEFVAGPLQIEGFIDQETDISQQFSLWDQRGSSVIRGNLIVIPLNDSFLYVEPIYLESETSALPELKRIIVASGEKIVMRETLDEALDALLSDEVPAVVVDDILPEEEPVTEDGVADGAVGEEPPEEETPSAPVPGSVDELVDLANQQFEAAEAAQRAGDWTTYGEQIEALRETLLQLEQLSGE